MIPCQRCQQRVATRTLHDAQGYQIMLCETCALKTAGGKLMQKMLLPILVTPPPSTPMACPSCDTTLQQLYKSSLLGCPDCYRHFREALQGTLQRIQGAHRHKPRPRCAHPVSLPSPPAAALLPDRWVILSQLKDQLARAVEDERYEDAAQLRDQIRSMELRS